VITAPDRVKVKMEAAEEELDMDPLWQDLEW
jgi:hypothetical protein